MVWFPLDDVTCHRLEKVVLRRGEQIFVLLAPTFQANYPQEYAKVLGGLKKLGVNYILSVSFGADIPFGPT